MNIAFLGYGNMAKALGGRFVTMKDTEVTVAGRDPTKAEALAQELGSACKSVATMAEAVADADAVVLATPHHAVFDAIATAGGPSAFAGRIVIDVNNPLPRYADGDFTLGTYDDHGKPSAGSLSLAEAIQAALPDATVVKAFNTAQAEVWTLDPMRPHDNRPFVFPICGNDANAKAVVERWVTHMGGGAWDVGGIEYASQLESLAAMTIQLLFKGRGPLTVFNLIEHTC
ncbi:NAD(P)-binding domain-containing protein [Cyanobium sp. LEGE 06143]|uniref:NADPH-dependent F420 reductase n=1 Tax=Cyanobium sp. LEGE 06143 TaxID=945727 RepID=UPI00188138F6|nr:NAD(P)-binding domain-containing protein [Cyanobium sp. LEGE 06143]MBE9172503.1 NAD(P)-binding domain-containing protein [Cyanobium sp. LEGE 06143]